MGLILNTLNSGAASCWGPLGLLLEAKVYTMRERAVTTTEGQSPGSDPPQPFGSVSTQPGPQLAGCDRAPPCCGVCCPLPWRPPVCSRFKASSQGASRGPDAERRPSPSTLLGSHRLTSTLAGAKLCTAYTCLGPPVSPPTCLLGPVDAGQPRGTSDSVIR